MLANNKTHFSWVKQVRIEEWCSISILLFFGAIYIIFFYDNKFSPIDSIKLIINYFTFGNPFYGLLIFGIYLIFLWKFWRYIVFQVINLLDRKPVKIHNKRDTVLYLLEPVRLILPFAISFAPLSILLINIDYVLRLKGMDILLWKGDAALFKIPPFISLSSLVSSEFVSTFLYIFYGSLSMMIGVALILLFLFHREKLFRHAVLSFMISVMIAFPFFYLVPCQDPYHSFIQNPRRNELPSQIQRVVSTYHPNQFVIEGSKAIGQAETDASNDNAVPVSCFPSTHAIWSYLIVYYLACLWPPSLFFTIPWIVLLLTGGLLFAQHYFVDYLAAVPVAFLGFALASYLLSRFGHWGEKRLSSEFSKEL